ncbi:MAG: DUF2244 domain-containing protein [Pseudomonadota bacterium]
MSTEKTHTKAGVIEGENQGLDEKQADDVIFHATLYPHRSLNRKGFMIFMGILLTLNIVISLYFYSRGAWPVVGFMGLEVLIIWLAFRASYLSAHDYETVTLTEKELIIEDHTRNRPYRRWTFNPTWVRITMDDPPKHESELTITSHGKGVVIGGFLSPQERLDLANALRQHVNKCRT